jgi:hypothetical protein
MENLKKLVELASKMNYRLTAEKTNEETGEKVVFINYPTNRMRSIISSYTIIEPKGPDKENRYPVGIKESAGTHHAVCNFPIPTKCIFNDEKRASKLIFYPVGVIENEVEYISKISISQKGKNTIIERVYLYYDIIKSKALALRIQKATINNEVYNKLKEEMQDDVLVLKHAKTNKDNKTVFFRDGIIDDRGILDNVQLLDKTFEFMDNDGETYEKEIEKQRIVGKYVFGVGITDASKQWKKMIIPVKIFTRRDATCRKDEDFFSNMKYLLNSGNKLKVNYDALYLNMLKDIEKNPTLFVYALATNKSNHEFGILLPIAEKKNGKWVGYSKEKVLHAINQVKGITTIKYKDTLMDLALRKAKLMTDIKEFANEINEKIEKANPPKGLLDEVKKDIEIYKNLQQIKESIDALTEEEIDKLINKGV